MTDLYPFVPIAIAIFWNVHHRFFMHIRKVDTRLMVYNLCWLLFIVTLPFSSTLVSAHFFETPSVFIYSVNILLITIFQNLMWDYVADRPEFLKESMTPDENRYYRIACNLAMINAVLALGLSFVSPIVAFIILFSRTLMFRLSDKRYSKWNEKMILRQERRSRR